MPHIPQGTTDTVALELFDPALDAALRPSPDYNVSRWLYVPNTYSEYRYILGTRGQKPLICVGINPSTAAPDALDPTLQSAQRIALNNGYDSFLMFKSLLAVLRPAIWFSGWAEVCPGKCLLTGQTGSEMSFVRCKWGFLRDYRCKVEGLMSINYLELCDFVKYIL